ncbi:MAG: hypothetical protein JJT94_02985 [Bernardetiaceae bacterium]|nr:hypothetical protein [Bernardetiaceae bacterium]
MVQERISKIKTHLDNLKNGTLLNKYPGFLGQGNLNDINNVSNQDITWTYVRKYWHLGEREFIEKLGTGSSTQFIFNLDKIKQYLKDNNALPSKTTDADSIL